MIDGPNKLPLPTIPHKTMAVHALSAPPAAGSLMQVCSLSPNGTTHLQQSCKKDVSHVWWWASAPTPHAVVPPPPPLHISYSLLRCCPIDSLHLLLLCQQITNPQFGDY